MNMKKSIAAVSAGAMAISAMATVASANVNVHPMNENATSAREQVVLTYDLAQYVGKFKPTQVRTVTTYYGDEYFINGLDIDAINNGGKVGVDSATGIKGSEKGYTVVLGGKLNQAPAAYYLQTVELDAKSMDHGTPSANGDQITGTKQHRQVWYSRATLGKDISDMQNDAVCVEDNLERVDVLKGKSGQGNKYNAEYGFVVEFNTANNSQRGDFILTDYKASINYSADATVSSPYHKYDFDNAFRVTYGKSAMAVEHSSLAGKDSEGNVIPFLGSDLSGSGKWAAESYEIVATVNYDNVNVELLGGELAYEGAFFFAPDEDVLIVEADEAVEDGDWNWDGKLMYKGTIITKDNVKDVLADCPKATFKPNEEDDSKTDVFIDAGSTVWLVGDKWELDDAYAYRYAKSYSGYDEDAEEHNVTKSIIAKKELADGRYTPLVDEVIVEDLESGMDEESELALMMPAAQTILDKFADGAEIDVMLVECHGTLKKKPVLVPRYTDAPMFTYYIVYTGDENDEYTKYKTLLDNKDTTQWTSIIDGSQKSTYEYFGTTMDSLTTWAREMGREAAWRIVDKDNKIQTIGDLVGTPDASEYDHIYYQWNGYEYVNYNFTNAGHRDNWDVPVVSADFVKSNPIVKQVNNTGVVNRENNAVENTYYRHYYTQGTNSAAVDVQKYSFQTYTVTCTFTVNITDWDNNKNYTGSEGTAAGNTKFDALHNGIRVIESTSTMSDSDKRLQVDVIRAQREAMEALLILSESNRAYVISGPYADLLKYDTLTGQQNYRGSTAVSVTTGAKYFGVKPMRSALNTPADVIWWLNQEKDGGKKYTSPVTVLNDVIGNNEEVSFRFISSKKRVRNTNALEVKGWRKSGDNTYTVAIKNPFTGETEVREISGFTPGDKTTLLSEFNGFTTNDGDPTISWYSPTFDQHLYGNPTYTTDNNHSLSTNGTGYPLSGTTTDGADNTGFVNPGNWGEGIGNYGSYNYGGWQTNLFNGGLVINSNWTMQINDTKHFDWGDDSIIFFWNDLTADVKTHASNFLVSMLLYTPTEWFWDTLEVGVGAAAAENVAKVDTGAGQDNDAAEVVEDEEIVEEETFEEEPEDYEEPEEEYFDEFEEEPEDEEYEDYEEYEEYEEPEDYEEEEEEEPEEEEEETVVVVQEVPSPKTGNSPIAFAVIPVALAAAAIVAKKKND